MVTQLQQAIREGAIDVTTSPGQQQPAGFRTIVRASRTASLADIARARQTGVFPVRFFSVQPTRVRSIGTFVPGVPRGIRGRPLTKASLIGLEKAGIIRPRFETRAGLTVKPKSETPSQKSFRLAAERRITRVVEVRAKQAAAEVKKQELERQRKFFKVAGGPLALQAGAGNIANTSAALRSIGRPGINPFQRDILLGFAKETGLGKINADFVTGRISRPEFVKLVNSSVARASRLQLRENQSVRDRILAGPLAKTIDSNFKLTINTFKNIPKPPDILTQEINALQKEQENINKIAKAFEKDVKFVDGRINSQVATQRDIIALDLTARLINKKQEDFNKKVVKFNARQAKIKSDIPRARLPDFTGELTLNDLRVEFDQIPKDADNVAKFFRGVLKTQAKDRRETFIINGKQVPKIDVIGATGALIGGVLGTLQLASSVASFSVQERFKRAFPPGEVLINPSIVQAGKISLAATPKFAKVLGGFLISNPLKFVKIENGKYFITPRAIGETGRAAFDVALLFSGSTGVSRKLVAFLLRLNKFGKPIALIGKLKLAPKKLKTSFFRNLKLKNFKDLGSTGARVTGVSRSVVDDILKIPEIRAGRVRLGFELGKAITTTKGITRQIARAQKKITEPIIDSVIKKTAIVRKTIIDVEVGGQLSLIEAQRLANSLSLLRRELTSLSNANKLRLSRRSLEVLFDKERKLLNELILFLRKKGNLARNRLLTINDKLASINLSIAKKLGVSRKFLLTKTRPFRRALRKEEIAARKKLKAAKESIDLIRLLLKKARTDARFVLTQSKSQFSALKKLFKLPQRSVRDLFGSEIKTAKRLLLRIEPALKKIEDVTLLQARNLRNKALKLKKMFNDEIAKIKLKGKKELKLVDVRVKKAFDRIAKTARNVRGDYLQTRKDIKKLFNTLDKDIQRKLTNLFKKVDRQLLNRERIIKNFLSETKQFEKLDKALKAKRIQREITRQLTKLQELQGFAEVALAKFKTRIRIELKDLRLGQRTSVIKGKRTISKIKRITKQGTLLIKSIVKSAPRPLKKKLKSLADRQTNRMIKTRNSFIKFIKGEELVALDKARIRGLQVIGEKEQAKRFVQAVNRAVAKFKKEAELLEKGIVLPVPTKLVGVRFRALLKQRPLVMKNFRKIIREGKRSLSDVNELIDAAVKGKRITPRMGDALKKLNTKTALRRAGVTAGRILELTRSPETIVKVNKRLSGAQRRKQGRIRQSSETGIRKFIKDGKLTTSQIDKIIADARFFGRINKRQAQELSKLNFKTGFQRAAVKARELKEVSVRVRERAIKRIPLRATSKSERFKVLQAQKRRRRFLNELEIRLNGLKRKEFQLRTQGKSTALVRKQIRRIENQIDSIKKKITKGSFIRKKRLRPTGAQRRQSKVAREGRATKKRDLEAEKRFRVSKFLEKRSKKKLPTPIEIELARARKQAENIIDTIQTKNIRQARIQRNIDKNLKAQRRTTRKEFGIKIKGIEPRRTFRRARRRELQRQERRLKREAVQTNKEIRFLEKQSGLVRNKKQLNKLVSTQKKKQLAQFNKIQSERIALENRLTQLFRTRDLLRKRPLNVNTQNAIFRVNVQIGRTQKRLAQIVRRGKSLAKQALVLEAGKFKPPIVRVKPKPVKPVVEPIIGKRTIQVQKQKVKKLGELKAPVTIKTKKGLERFKREKKIKVERAKSRLRQFEKARAKLLKARAIRPVVIVRPKETIRLSESIQTRAIEAARTRGLTRVTVKVIQKPATKPAQAVRVVARVALKPRSVTIQAIKFVPRLRLRRATRLRLRRVTLQRLKLRQKIKRRIVPPIIPIPNPKTLSFESIANLDGPFNIIARSRGKQVKLNTFPLTGAQALGLGGNKVDNRAIRSFAIVKTTGKTRKIKVPRFKARKFRRPIGNTKLQRFFLVEKVKFAIDTRGEKREITLKGIRAARKKKRKKIVKRKTRVIKRTRKRIVKRRRKSRVRRRKRVRRRRK